MTQAVGVPFREAHSSRIRVLKYRRMTVVYNREPVANSVSQLLQQHDNQVSKAMNEFAEVISIQDCAESGVIIYGKILCDVE